MNANRIPLILVLVAAATGCGSSMSAAAPPVSASVSPEAPPAADMSGSDAVASVESAPRAPMAMPQSHSTQSTSTSDSSASMKTATPVAHASTTPVAAKTAAPDTKKNDAQAADFLIMYTGDVTMAVDDGKVASTIDRIIDASEQVGGHLAGRRDLSVSIRVPSARFREALGKITELGEVTHQAVTAEDVSEEYHDAEVRIANLKATRTRLQDFLSKTASVSDMLTLERELERVSMDIDRIEGRMRFLREHVAFSTLTVALVARPKSQNVVAGGGKPTGSAPRVMHLQAEWLDDMGVPKLIGE